MQPSLHIDNMHNATEIFPNAKVAEDVTNYAIEHSTSLGKTVNQHRDDTIALTETTGLDPFMMINTLQVCRRTSRMTRWAAS